MGCYEYFAAQGATVRFMDYTGDSFDPWVLSSEKTYSKSATYGSLPTPKRDNHFFAGWWTDPVAGTQVFAASAVTAYRLYSHWVSLYSDDETRTSCKCNFKAAQALVKPLGDSFDQTVGTFSAAVPSKIDGLAVTDIGFSDEVLTKVAGISLPGSITRIDDWAFGNCSSLAGIAIPSSVRSLGDYVFGDCTSLASVTIPRSVTSVGYGLFYNCPELKTVRLQNGSPLAPGEDFTVPAGCTVVRY